MHKLLERQIKRHLGGDAPPALRGLVEEVDEAYRQADAERDGLERSLDLRGRELREREGALARESEQRQRLEVELRQAEKLKAVGQLTSGIAHEINTPVQFVGDSITFLRDAFGDISRLLDSERRLRAAVTAGEMPPGEASAEAARCEQEADLEFLLEEIPKALERTSEGIGRVGDMVRAMKNFAHPSRREKAAADLNAALTTTLVVARNEIKYVADVETAFGDLPGIDCHVGDLQQVFLNLLVNAAHAVADRVGDSGERGLVRVATYVEGGAAVVAISDTGCGIPEAARSRIFEPFFTTKEAGRGTGQGLPIARSLIVERHGGDLSFETECGRGTTFYVRLPLDAARAASGSAP